MKPILSVVTITYKDSSGLAKTLHSLKPLRDLSLPFEHIIVDSSPEENEGIITSNGDDWPLVRLKTPPRGIYPAFNLGIEHSRGDFIWFLNGGDRLRSGNDLFNVIKNFQNDTEIVCAGVDAFREGQFTYSVVPKAPLISCLVGENSICHQGMIYRPTVFKKIGVFSESYKLVGDYEHHFRCYLQNINVGFSQECIAEFDRDGRSDQFKNVFREYKEIWQKYSHQLGLRISTLNFLWGLFHFVKLSAIRSPLIKPIEKPLKALWYKAHRH